TEHPPIAGQRGWIAMHPARVRVPPSERAVDAWPRRNVCRGVAPEHGARRRATQSPWRLVWADHGRPVFLTDARTARARGLARASQAGSANAGDRCVRTVSARRPAA